MEDFSFEQGPIRPPSEARSLLIRVTRNCPWNKCAFCHSYRDTPFALRTVEDIKKDIGNAGHIASEIRSLSWKLGEGGRITESVVNQIWNHGEQYHDGFKSVGSWLYDGGESVFLQDADSLIVKTDHLVEILNFGKETFPFVKKSDLLLPLKDSRQKVCKGVEKTLRRRAVKNSYRHGKWL
jgi:hypothetical protein